MDYKIAVCDDSDADRQYISRLVGQWAAGSGHTVQVDSFVSAENFLFHYADENDHDILLLDIEMGDMDGVTLAKKLRQENETVQIVFITGYSDYIAEGYEVDALHYLVKPVSEEKLSEVLDRAAAKLASEPPSVVISCEVGTVKLFESDILYVEAFAHYVELHTRSGVYRLKESITAFEERLSGDFYRAHRSYIVNLKAVERISRTGVMLAGGAEIPLSRGKYDDINRAFIERN